MCAFRIIQRSRTKLKIYALEKSDNWALSKSTTLHNKVVQLILLIMIGSEQIELIALQSRWEKKRSHFSTKYHYRRKI